MENLITLLMRESMDKCIANSPMTVPASVLWCAFSNSVQIVGTGASVVGLIALGIYHYRQMNQNNDDQQQAPTGPGAP